MTALLTGQEVAFWLLAPVMVLAACAMIISRKPVHSALCLATVMVCLAVQYAALEAPFLFAVQIIVYTGAILMLFVFVVMLVGVDSRDSLVEVLRGQRILAGLAGLGVLILLVGAVGSAFTSNPLGLAQVNTTDGGNVNAVAGLIFGRYVMVFHAAGALLLTATVAALILAHRETLSKPRSQEDRMRGRMKRYAETGEHPGPLPTPGYYARRSAVDVPALLPDGTPADASVSTTLRARGQILDPKQIAEPTRRTYAAVEEQSNAVSSGSAPAVSAGSAPDASGDSVTDPAPQREPATGFGVSGNEQPGSDKSGDEPSDSSNDPSGADGNGGRA